MRSIQAQCSCGQWNPQTQYCACIEYAEFKPIFVAPELIETYKEKRYYFVGDGVALPTGKGWGNMDADGLINPYGSGRTCGPGDGDSYTKPWLSGRGYGDGEDPAWSYSNIDRSDSGLRLQGFRLQTSDYTLALTYSMHTIFIT